jgi:hypothetical protein
VTTLGVKDVCKALGCGEGTVLYYVRTGQLKAINIARDPKAKRPHWRIDADALEAFVRSRESCPAPTPVAAQPRKSSQKKCRRFY